MWHKKDDKPKQNKKILVISPIYPVDHEMRSRIINSEFLSTCHEVEKWAYVEELEEPVTVHIVFNNDNPLEAFFDANMAIEAVKDHKKRSPKEENFFHIHSVQCS